MKTLLHHILSGKEFGVSSGECRAGLEKIMILLNKSNKSDLFD